jgi:hypothetical protein
MSKVIADISMSLDGYVTARGVDQEHGLGIGGEAIHAWVLQEPRSPVDEAVLAHSFEKTGAVVMGRRRSPSHHGRRTSPTRSSRTKRPHILSDSSTH